MTHAPDALLLTDGVVLLDRFTDADVDSLWAGEDNHFARRSCQPGPFARRDIAHRISRWEEQGQPGGSARAFAVRETSSRRLVGGCVLDERPDDSGIAELSYWIFPPYRRRGYASRAVALVCQHAFDDLRVSRIELYIEPTNDASLRVAGNTGFLREGLHRPPDRWHGDRSDMVLFSRGRTDTPASGHGVTGVPEPTGDRNGPAHPNRRWAFTNRRRRDAGPGRRSR